MAKRAYFLGSIVAGLAAAACGGGGNGNGNDDAPLPDASPDAGLSFEAQCAAQDEALGITRPAGWAPASHCTFAPVNADQVFALDRVHTMTITMTPAEYAAMQADLQDLFNGGGFAPDLAPNAACAGRPADAACQVDVGAGAEPGACVTAGAALACAPVRWQARAALAGPSEPCSGHDVDDGCTTNTGATGTCAKTIGPLICQVDGFDAADVSWVPDEAAAPFWPRDPLYFHADVAFDDVTFTSVALRYKGNNGLASSQGDKRPLHLKLDGWEATVPAITDQRLFGFQSLSMSPNWTDGSNLHQVLAAKMFRDAGVPAPLASFVEVSLDTGAGPALLGVYALSEIPDNPLLERAFDDDHGNLYKPDGRGAHLIDFVEASFHKKNNDTTDFADVQAMFAALHGAQADRLAWRAGLKAMFDVTGFARAYAVNQAMSNWDTYGGLAHNFYFYADPAGGQLTYIPWDFDLSFDGTGYSDLSLGNFGGEWPLLQAIARDADFATTYRAELATVHQQQLVSGNLAATVDTFETLIRDAVEREDVVHPGRADQFDGGVQAVRDHLTYQTGAIADFLAAQPNAARQAPPRFGAAPAAELRAWREAVAAGR